MKTAGLEIVWKDGRDGMGIGDVIHLNELTFNRVLTANPPMPSLSRLIGES